MLRSLFFTVSVFQGILMFPNDRGDEVQPLSLVALLSFRILVDNILSRLRGEQW